MHKIFFVPPGTVQKYYTLFKIWSRKVLQVVQIAVVLEKLSFFMSTFVVFCDLSHIRDFVVNPPPYSGIT